MRVISGKWRGRNFYVAKGASARPTSDMIREALMNILYGRIEGAVVVDLFAGGGGFGIEALSRGAEQACFCDMERRSIGAIRHYMDEYDAQPEEYALYAMDYRRAITRMENDGVVADVVFIDPPYASDFYEDAMTRCAALMAADGIVILEHDKRRDIQAVPGYEHMQDKRYGSTIISIYRYTGADA